MAQIKLKPKAPGAPTPTRGDRTPVRGKGLSKPRPTLAQAQAEREQRAAERAARAAERWEPTEPPQSRPPARPPVQRGAPTQGQAPSRGPSSGPSRSAERQPPRSPNRAGPAAPRPRPAPAAAPSEQGERLSKRLSELKLASRREADEWIEAGWVKVDGRMAVLGQRVLPDARIEIDPAARQQQAERVTILLNKPIGYVSGQAEDGYEPAVVLVTPENHWSGDASKLQPHPGQRRGLAPAGRLDIDSTGMLVLTQDGRVAKTLIGDDSDVEKEYLVRVEYVGRPGHPPVPEGTLPNSALPPEDMALLNHGLSLDGVMLRPAKVSWQNEHQLRVVLKEGRKRQIRRMCELVGLKVVGLKRVRIGRIALGQLPLGQWRYLSPWESF
jgi:23S rRNA pseudouridine2604 synthase